MSAMTFSFVDVVVVLIILVSTGYAVYRGFVSETLSIFAWAAAAFATLYFGPWVAPLLHGLISPNWLADIIGYAIVFVTVLIPLSFASHRFSQGVRGSPINALDQTMGGVFGVIRALALVGIMYLIYSAFVPVREQPRMVTNAWFLPVIQSSSEVLLSLVPDQSQRAANDKPHAALPHQHHQNLVFRCPQRTSDAKFLRAQRNGTRDDTIHATASQQYAEATKSEEQFGNETDAGNAAQMSFGQAHDILQGQIAVDTLYFTQ